MVICLKNSRNITYFYQKKWKILYGPFCPPPVPARCFYQSYTNTDENKRFQNLPKTSGNFKEKLSDKSRSNTSSSITNSGIEYPRGTNLKYFRKPV